MIDQTQIDRTSNQWKIVI